MAIQDIIDEYLLEEQNVKRIRSGLWSPSSYGRCVRYQWWNRKDEPQSNPPDARTLRKFKRGKLFHDLVQGLILKANPLAEKEVEIQTKDVRTFVDIVTPEEAIEIKSQGTRDFSYSHFKTTRPISEVKYGHFLQAISGAVLTDKDFARLVYVDTDTLQIKEYKIPITGENIGKLEAELRLINSYWPDKLPEATPRAFKNKDGISSECQYCSFRDSCNRRELGGT